MDIKIRNNIKDKRNKDLKNKELLILPNFDINKTVDELKQEIIKHFELKIHIDRLGLSYIIEDGCEERFPMSELNKKINEHQDFNPKAVVILKDLGPQISYRLTYNLEYIGPIFILSYFYFDFFTEVDEFTSAQHIFYYTTMFHFIRRILESNFVHIFSRRTMPLRNLFKNCAYYWILCGFLCGYNIYKPLYHEYFTSSKVLTLLTLFYINTELKNLRCHMILREIKILNDGEKSIPYGEGFNLVTCANYNWEFLGWVMLSLITFHWSVILFTIVGFFQMRQWALKKHNYLKKKYPNYPKERFAFIPFLC